MGKARQKFACGSAGAGPAGAGALDAGAADADAALCARARALRRHGQNHRTRRRASTLLTFHKQKENICLHPPLLTKRNSSS